MRYQHTTSEAEFQELRAEIARAGSVKATIVSDSMAPVIRAGEDIEIQKIEDPSRLRKFDILVHWNGEILVCHYLRHRNEHFQENGEALFVTRGLRLEHEDLPITSSRLLGRVAVTIPWYFKLWEVIKPSARR